MNKQPIIEVNNLELAYDTKVIQRDLNFTINRGDIFMIMGGSGCGKSTLMRHLVGLRHTDKGEIRYYGEPVDEDRFKHLIRKFGVLYQGGALWSSMTLSENIALPLEHYTQLSPPEIQELVSLKLALVGLAGYEGFYPSEISGGMRKRAGLARAIALDPEIIFFDEPSAGLDPVTSKQLDHLIKELRDSLGATIVIVSHELASIFDIGDNSILLDADKKTIIAKGNPSKLLAETKDPAVMRFLTRGERIIEG